jgi:hypothetical protein
MTTRHLLLPCLFLFASPAVADNKEDGEKLARIVAPFVDDQTFAIVHVDLPRLDIGPVFDQIKKFGAPDKELMALEVSAKAIIQQMAKDGLKHAFVVVSLADLPDSLPLFVVPLGGDADDKALRMFVALMDGGGTVKFEKRDGLLLVGPERALNRVKKLKAEPRLDLAAAFSSTGDSAARLVVFPNETMRKSLWELAPTLPREVGGGSTTILTRGVEWAALGAKFAPALEFTAAVQASDESAAKTLVKIVEDALGVVRKMKGAREVYPDLDKLTEALVPKREGSRLTLTLKQEQLLAMLVPAAKKLRESARTAVLMNNLKQIGLAFHSHAQENKALPANASFDKQGKPLLSWRVHLLPYLGQDALYKEFKLDEAWDSPHNKKLIKRMPKVYASSSNPNLTAEGRTTYVVATGPMTPFTEKKGMPFSKVTDGLSNTILALDVDDEHAVIWTKPEDLSVDLKNPARGLRKIDGSGFLVLMMDGSVLVLSATTEPKNLAARITPAGDEVITEP